MAESTIIDKLIGRIAVAERLTGKRPDELVLSRTEVRELVLDVNTASPLFISSEKVIQQILQGGGLWTFYGIPVTICQPIEIQTKRRIVPWQAWPKTVPTVDENEQAWPRTPV